MAGTRKVGSSRVDVTPELLAQPIAVLQLREQSVNALVERGVTTIGELLQWCPYDPCVCACDAKHLLMIANFGEKSLQEVFDKLCVFGIQRTV